MPESIHSIAVTVTVNTNKRTTVCDIEADTLDDALDKVRDHLGDIRWAIR